MKLQLKKVSDFCKCFKVLQKDYKYYYFKVTETTATLSVINIFYYPDGAVGGKRRYDVIRYLFNLCPVV